LERLLRYFAAFVAEQHTWLKRRFADGEFKDYRLEDASRFPERVYG